MVESRRVVVKGIPVVIYNKANQDFVSLTDIARYKGAAETDDVIKNWMRNRSTIEFLGLWEKINNSKFNPVEFDGFISQAGSNHFVMSPSKWVLHTKAVGVVSKPGRNGGTFAHKDIAFEFASWISPEFKLFLIKEFQRLKEQESVRLALGWDVKRTLAKINYKIHTDAIKENLIPPKISKTAESVVYANEADVLNMALFGMTAKSWRDNNSGKEGNIRDYALVEQLVVLSNLESLNAEFIREGFSQSDRLRKLNEIAITQMKSILNNPSLKNLV